MDALMISAASGMKARMDSLDMLANNVANTNTAGFKADREFYNLYKDQLPVVQTHWTDFSQGLLTQTSNPLNLALSGAGFFALNEPNGVVYTRGGDVHISKANQLVSVSGYTLRNVLDQGKPITVDPTLPVTVTADGSVMQSAQVLGKLEIDEIAPAAGTFEKLGNTYFALGDPKAKMQPATNAEVHQGYLEQSNVPVADSAVRLVSVMRQFDMLQRAMNIGTQMDKAAVQDVAKPG
jgi:flagellar basal-body rod protein FlgF